MVIEFYKRANFQWINYIIITVQHKIILQILVRRMSAEGKSFLDAFASDRLANKININIVKLSQRELRNGKIDQVKLFDNAIIPAYQREHNVMVGKQRTGRIWEQLNLQLEAKRAALDRIAHKGTYLECTFNPLSMQQESYSQKSSFLKQRKKVNIFEGLQNTKQKANMAIIQQRLHKLQLAFFKRRIKATQQTSPIHRYPISFDFYKEQQVPQRHSSSEMRFQFLDRIKKRKDQCSFRLDFSSKQLNLFSFLSGKSPREFTNYRETLNRFHFSHDSIAHNPKNMQGLTTFQQISRVSRQFITQKHNLIADKHRLQSSLMRFNLERLSFEEVMLASTGMLESQQLTNYLHENVGVSGSTQIDDLFYDHSKRKENPVYEPNQRYTHTLFEHESNNAHLEANLHKNPLNRNELDQMMLSKQLKYKIEFLLNKQRLLITYGIKDHKIREQINNEKAKIMNQQLVNNNNANLSSGKKYEIIDVDRKIKMSKNYKDRSEGIKNKFVQANLDFAKKQQQSTKPPINRKVKKRHLIADYKSMIHKTERFFEGSIDTARRKSVKTSIKRSSGSLRRADKSNQIKNKFIGNNRYMKF